MRKVLKNKKGITLIPLVLTIIILLILAGVSISALGGENGLIAKTKIAKEENKKSEYKDYLAIAKTEAIAEKGGQDINLDEYIEQIKADKIEGIKSIEKITNDKASVITKEGYIFIITVNTIDYYENENSLPEMNIKDANIEFAFNPNTWTNESIEITVSKKESKYTIQLSKDTEKWTTTTTMTFEENGEIYARLIDEIGRTSDIASRKISIIDTEKPVITEVTSSTNSVRIKATDDAAGVVGYVVTTINTEPTEFTECESTKELDVTVPNLTQGTAYYAWVKDAAGNVSASKSTDTGTVTGLTISTNTANWSTSKTITITATNSNYSNIRYTTDETIPTSTTGTAYTEPFTITSNCTITAVAFDSTGQAGSTATNKVTTIDTEKPNKPTISVTSGTVGNNNYYRSNVTVKITAGTDSQSGVNKTTYILSGSTTKSETTITSGGTVTISNEGTTTITAYTYDDVNNKSNAETLTIKKDATPPTITPTFSENATQALVRMDLKDDNGVKSIKVGNTTTDTKNQKNWRYDMYTSTDGSTKITVTDVAGNTTTRTHKIKFLYTHNNLRTENTGGWNQNYYKNKFGDIINVNYSNDGGLFILATPTELDVGRLGSWYTKNSISLSGYDTIRSVSWMDKTTTGIIRLGLGEDIKDNADLNKAKSQNDYDGSSGYWTRLQADISSRNDSQQIVIGTYGGNNDYIYMFLVNMYMYSFK